MTSSQGDADDRRTPGSASGPGAAPDNPAVGSAPTDGDAEPRPIASDAEPKLESGPAPRLGPVLAVYSAERIGLLLLLALLLSLFLTPLVAMMFAVVLQMPLAWLLFAKQRAKVNAAMASSRRRTDREQLRRALSGEDQSIG